MRFVPSLRARPRVPRGTGKATGWYLLASGLLFGAAGLLTAYALLRRVEDYRLVALIIFSAGIGVVFLAMSRGTRWRRKEPGPLPWQMRLWIRFVRISFFAGGYFFFAALFGPQWGRPDAGKWAMMALLGFGLALSLDVFRLPRGARQRALRGRRGAQRAVRWPPWRRTSAVLTGAGLAAFALVQRTIGFEGVTRNPIAEGVCMIVVGGLGVTLIVIGMENVWRRRRDEV